VYVSDETWKILDSLSPSELSPVVKEWNDRIFPYFSYYQTIENTFPELAKHLALRWEIYFDTLKEIIWTRNDDRYAHIWDTVLNSKWFTEYMLAKKNWNVEEKFSEWEIAFYEANVDIIWNIEAEIEEARNTTFEFPRETEAISDIQVTNDVSQEDIQTIAKTSSIYVLAWVLVLLLIIWILVFKRKK
jgi:hypothetical protein